MRGVTRDSQDAGSKPAEEKAPANSYRCPVCGQMVDGNNPEQILLHHEHVTHPDRFHFTFPAAA